MLRAVLFIVICGCVVTYNHDCQMCIRQFGVFNCNSPRFSKCVVIHGSESTIREIRLFNCDVWIIPNGWSPDFPVNIRDGNAKICEDYRHFKTVESNTLDPFTSQVSVTNEVPKVQATQSVRTPITVTSTTRQKMMITSRAPPRQALVTVRPTTRQKMMITSMVPSRQAVVTVMPTTHQKMMMKTSMVPSRQALVTVRPSTRRKMMITSRAPPRQALVTVRPSTRQKMMITSMVPSRQALVTVRLTTRQKTSMITSMVLSRQALVTDRPTTRQIFKTVKAPRKGSHDNEDDDDEMFDIPTATGFLAWAITCTLAIILIILKKYLLKTFHPCNRCKAQSQPDTQPSSAIPLSIINTPSPTLATPSSSSSSSSSSYDTPQQSTAQSQPDTQTSSAIPLPIMNTPPPCLATPSSLSYDTPQQSSALPTPSSTKELISPPAKNTRSRAKGKKLFKL